MERLVEVLGAQVEGVRAAKSAVEDSAEVPEAVVEVGVAGAAAGGLRLSRD